MIATILLLTTAFSLHTPRTETVAIICSNDIHGNVFPYPTIRLDTKEPFLYGGLEYMAQMVETIKEEYKGNVLYLDAGDQLLGGVEITDSVSSG